MKKFFIIGFSLLYLVTTANTIFAQNSPDLVVDISGSMTPFASRLTEIAQRILVKYPDSKAFLFNNIVRVVSSPEKLGKLVQPRGSTDLALAFQKVYKESAAPALILITDGKPDDDAKAKDTALTLRTKGIKICTCFIGEGKMPPILAEISDEFIISDNIEVSIDKCLQGLRARGIIIDPSREIDIEGLSKSFEFK